MIQRRKARHWTLENNRQSRDVWFNLWVEVIYEPRFSGEEGAWLWMACACAWRKQSDKIWILKSQLQERYCRCTAGPCRISQGPKSDYLPSKQTMLLWTGLDLYEEMQKFYRDFYSANGMTLSVIGKESIPELEVPCAAFFSLNFSCLIWINELCRLWFERSFPPLWTRTWPCPKAGEKKAAVKSLHTLTSYALPQGDAVSEHPPFIPKDWTGWTATV